MKLHELRPAEGAHRPRTRVGRGIAAGKGKTAGRGTKGQKSRTGGTIQPWFEGGQTPIHIRVPKLRGFRNPFKVEFEIVNVGRLSELAETGILDPGDMPGAEPSETPAPVTITADILAAVGLVRSLDKPLKVLGHGDVSRPLFVVADAFSKSAAAKIEAAGGTVQVLVFPTANTAEPAELAADAPVSARRAPKPAAASAEPPAARTKAAGAKAPAGAKASAGAKAPAAAKAHADAPAAPEQAANPEEAATPDVAASADAPDTASEDA